MPRVLQIIAGHESCAVGAITKKGPGSEWCVSPDADPSPSSGQSHSFRSSSKERVSSETYDYVVIGSGPAGVGAFRALSRSSVLLLERSNHIGGIPNRVRLKLVANFAISIFGIV